MKADVSEIDECEEGEVTQVRRQATHKALGPQFQSESDDSSVFGAASDARPGAEMKGSIS